jgi:aspartate/methionine/tyrosine aminotransferase
MPIAKTIAGQLERASWIRRMFEEGARLKRERGEENVYDFTLGNPDVEPPAKVLETLRRVASSDRLHAHGYMPNPGFPEAREAVAALLRKETGLGFAAENVFMTVGSAGACNVILKSILDPGDEVIVLMPCFSEYPFYVTNHAGRMVPVETDDEFLPDVGRIAAAITPRTRAIILNTPNNPTGRVFDRAELEAVADVCRTHGIVAVTDEIYEHILYEGEHVPLATLDGMRDRTITVSGASKTFSVTGWRIGTIVAPARLTGAIRKVHDFLTVGAPAPFQEAVAEAMDGLGPSYYDGMAAEYRERRDVLVEALVRAGFGCRAPQGAYYVLADFSALSRDDDTTFAKRLVREAGVASVPGSSFFSTPGDGASLVRFAFCKRLETLRDAGERLAAFAG